METADFLEQTYQELVAVTGIKDWKITPTVYRTVLSFQFAGITVYVYNRSRYVFQNERYAGSYEGDKSSLVEAWNTFLTGTRNHITTLEAEAQNLQNLLEAVE